MFLARHVIPDSLHFFWRDLMHSDNSAVPTQTIGHFPVIEATVLKRMYAQLSETQSYVDILKVKQPCVEGGLVNKFCYIG